MKLKEAADFANTGLPGTDRQADLPRASTWQARLVLGFADDAGTTRLVERTHFGPLRVQKPLYPEGARVCHAIVVHPPGGVVGGDELALVAKVDQAAHAFITTPGAAKWYKANGRTSRQDIRLEIAAGAKLEWLPQETIFFDAAQVQLTQSVALGKDASYIGCEILCFGRTASGESFTSGKVSQRTSIRRESKLIWWEQGVLAGGSGSMLSPLGLSGKTVCATLIAVGKPLPASLLNTIRQEVDMLSGNDGAFGISQLKSVLVARYLGDSSEIARRAMLCVWQHVRPDLMACAAVVPRIWNT
ncbi:urease accessory protein UreD [Undibacterium arcticum]|uniref:Urease accessory protein UreD n=1 Tax=Undibacterium arcticum TaxID=1762892 RepID=A0ABV7EW85_9BURK